MEKVMGDLELIAFSQSSAIKSEMTLPAKKFLSAVVAGLVVGIAASAPQGAQADTFGLPTTTERISVKPVDGAKAIGDLIKKTESTIRGSAAEMQGRNDTRTKMKNLSNGDQPLPEREHNALVTALEAMEDAAGDYVEARRVAAKNAYDADFATGEEKTTADRIYRLSVAEDRKAMQTFEIERGRFVSMVYAAGTKYDYDVKKFIEAAEAYATIPTGKGISLGELKEREFEANKRVVKAMDQDARTAAKPRM